ncbi:hypothetical protein [Enterococcus moraviensis]|uniref:hypothetical protein n=1 Tax=Enterococcus moraviensis TaxID=155617 RepID=UPI001114BE9F|nr:hypothetical protein [Enterococcus moraviensis]
MKRSIKKSDKILVSIILMTCISLGLALWAYLPKNEVMLKAKANDGNPIVVDKGTDAAQELPFDGQPVFEATLKGKFPDYSQNQKVITNLTRGPIHGRSSVITDQTPTMAVKTEDGNIIQVFIHHSLPFEIPNHSIITELVLVDGEGNIKNQLWISGGTPSFDIGKQFDDRSYAIAELLVPVGNGQYELLYTGYYNDKDIGPSRLVVDKDLNILSRSKIETNGYPENPDNQSMSRASMNYNKDIYKYSYIDLNGVTKATRTDAYNTIKLDANGNYTTPVLLTSMQEAFDYGVKLGYGKGELPEGATDGLLPESLVRSESQEYVAISVLTSTQEKPFYFLNIWDETGNLRYTYEPVSATIEYLQDISSPDYYYFIETGEKTYLKRLEVNEKKVVTIKEYPKGTSLLINPGLNDDYTYFGYTNSFSGELNGYGTEPGLIMGNMDKDFNILSLATIDSTEKLNVRNLIQLTDTNVYTSGEVSGTQFVDDFPTGGPYTKRGTAVANNFYGILNAEDDFAPIIKAPKQLIMNQDDPALQTEQAREEFLLTGEVGINNYEGLNATKVYDQFDFNRSMSPKDQEWLNNRINRNPEKIDNPIDWDALGFDFKTVGSQNVTYFVSDSQKQITSTSSRVNVVTDGTIYNKKGMLDAHNFHIPLTDVTKVTDAALRSKSNYAKLVAWDIETGDSLLSLPSKEGIEINQEQLKAIQETKKEGIFDLTFTLNYGDEPKQQTVKVYVGGEKVGDYVFYSTDFTIPWDISRNTTSEELLSEEYGKVSAYQISKGTEMSNLKVSDNAVATFKAIDPVSGEVKQLLPIQILEPETNKVLAESTLGPNGTVYYRYEEVVVQFVDEAYQLLYDENDTNFPASTTLGERIVGKQLNIAEETDIITQKATIEKSKGYEFLNYYQADMKTVYPIDGLEVPYLEGKGWTAYLQFKGTLRFIKVPETMRFENGKVSVKDQKLEASSTNESLFIGDNRTAQEKDRGWRLYAKINQDFVSLDNDRLPNILYYNDQPIAKSNVEIKMNNSVTKTEVKLTKDSGLNLRIPGGTAKKKTYGAAIIWELTAAL